MSAVPTPTTLFVGRETELARLEEKLARVPIAIIYGVPGIGKSTLAYALAARWKGPVAYRKAGVGEPIAALIDDVRRQLARGPVAEAANDEERLADLAARMDAVNALWLLDDLHNIKARAALLRAFGQSVRAGRLVATSRELLLLDPAGPDRLDLRLEALDRESARSLWAQLDELYGKTDGFDAMWARWGGNPFLVRRAHAGGLAGDDPIAASLRQLSASERFVAGALAIAAVHLPANILAGLLPGDQASEALRRLVTRLIAEVDATGAATVHDVYREHIERDLEPEERQSLHQRLGRLIDGAPELDPVVRVREVSRHLRAAQRWQQAGAYLVDQGANMVRLGAAGEMLRGLEAIPREHRSPEVQVARARGLARILDLPRAYDELARLVAAGMGPEQELKLTYGQVAMLTGHLDVASRVLGELHSHRRQSPELRIRALTAWALTLGHQGRAEAACAHLVLEEEKAARSGDLLPAGNLALGRTHLLWLEERDREALDPMHRARHLLLEARLSTRAAVMAPATFAGVLARLGRLDDAAEALRTAEGALARHDDPLLRAEVRAMRACVLYERGDRDEARAELLAVAEVFERGGCLVGALWARAWVGRALLVMGRRCEGAAILDETWARAQSVGMASVARAVERGRVHDVLSSVQEEPRAPVAESKRGELARWRALIALRAATAGDERPADALLVRDAVRLSGPGYALDRALARLAKGIALRVQGSSAAAAAEIARAVDEAEGGGVDPDLVPEVLAATGTRRDVYSSRHPPGIEVAGDVSSYDVVLDRRRHLLKLGRREVTLARRPALRRLLYALAASPGAFVSKEKLARSLWSGDYHPLVHDNPLRVNILRLRSLLGKGLSIEVDEAGYRLRVPNRFLYIQPLEPEAR